MNDEIKHRFESVGLAVIGTFSGTGPTVTEAFHRVVNVEAQPVETIPRDTPDLAVRVNEAWTRHARERGVLDEDDTFLAAGSLEQGWFHVRLTSATNLFFLQDSEGDLLFVARDLSGRQVCAVSREGAEYWILEEEFHQGDTAP
ncbi:hypothetical protein AB0F30_02465 [Streptomyces sp. NPDC029006]|uniref:hypothetical protein n=1 Tax=Streptomyces sp. NPDC029006 TaxID=3155467 RepID=UPI0033E6481A